MVSILNYIKKVTDVVIKSFGEFITLYTSRATVRLMEEIMTTLLNFHLMCDFAGRLYEVCGDCKLSIGNL